MQPDAVHDQAAEGNGDRTSTAGVVAKGAPLRLFSEPGTIYAP
jgi:hypothetical protein